MAAMHCPSEDLRSLRLAAYGLFSTSSVEVLQHQTLVQAKHECMSSCSKQKLEQVSSRLSVRTSPKYNAQYSILVSKVKTLPLLLQCSIAS
eukprot:5891790-Amphidinium_carterae.1